MRSAGKRPEGEAMILFPEIRSSENIERVKTHPYFKRGLQLIREQRDELLAAPIEPLPFNLYDRFFRDGDRGAYEHLYFRHRARLVAFTISYLLYRNEEDLHALEDVLWAVCDEYTWVLPAHIDEKPDGYDTFYIDLFSAETGSAFAEILSLFENELNPKVVKRMKEAVTARIFDIYENRGFFWDTMEMNWASVCAGSVGVAYMYLAPERFLKVKERINETMEAFLRGYGTDGICTEGIGYWHYGFGYFMYYAQMLKEFTDGKEDFFARPIVEKSAYFQQNALMRQNYSISFSDGSQVGGYVPGMTHKLREIYGDSVRILPEKYISYQDHCSRFLQALRDLFWVDPDREASAVSATGTAYFSGAQWYLKNTEKLSLAAKGGTNGEPHNHNDIGSFLLIGDAGQILCDFGSGEYTRDYFRDEYRYTYLCNSSRGHSVPVFSGTYQAPGEAYQAKALQHDACFTVEIAGAYPEGTVQSLIRSMDLQEDGFTLTDCYQFADGSRGNQVTERFVTELEPLCTEEGVCIGGFTMKASCGGKNVSAVISSEELKAHMGAVKTLYFIDYQLEDPAEFRMELR